MDYFLNFIITWSVGLVLPLLIRFAFLRRPLSKKHASWIAFGNSAILWIFFTVALLLVGERDPSYGFVWILVFFVARAILSLRPSDLNINRHVVNNPITIDEAETINTFKAEALDTTNNNWNERINGKSKSNMKHINNIALIVIILAFVLIPTAFLYVYYYMPVASLSLDKNTVTLEAGGQEDILIASIEPFFLRNRELVWSTTDPHIVSVSSTGLLTPISDGVATVKVTTIDENKTAKCTVTVIQPTIPWRGGEYKGELEYGIPNGFGQWTHPDGFSYYGRFKDGNLDGQGEMIFPDGREYDGEWSNNKMSGQGILRFPNGDIYDGSFKDDLFHGYGTMNYISGARYAGDWKYGIEDGIGTLTYQGGIVYKGGFKDGKYDRFGRITWPDGTKFRGQFKEGNRHGTGEMTFPDGSSLMAVYENDELTHGVWTYPDGTRSATGPEQWRIYD